MDIEEIKNSTVLIVDDNLDNLSLFFDWLSKFDLTVLVAQCGEDALEAVRENIPDIILLDIVMPGIDGYETCRRLKSNPKTRSIPVIFASSLSEPIDKLKGFEAGAVDFITKPFDFRETLARLTTHLELHKLKRELSEANQSLRKEIIERRKAEETAKAADQAKSDFLANMSHELRTPLNGILGYAQILKRDKDLSASQKKGINIIERSGTHLLNLINDILDLAKIEAKKIEFAENVFPLDTFLDGLIEMIRIQAENKNLMLNIALSSDLPVAIKTDERRLSQILLNLLSNAVKYTVAGTVTFRVCRADSKIRFQIDDTGVGIPQGKLQEIFIPFAQMANHAKKEEGTGLGLSITRELVKLMGGNLQVQSTPGVGSSFWFELELPEETEWISSEESNKGQIIGYVSSTPVKILIVDDKWENRTILASLLVPLGFEIREAENGQEAMEKLAQWHPNLIFLDLIMPVMDGFEAARRIRSNPGFQHIKIIAISASTLMAPEEVCKEFGCDSYIAKPIQIQEVLDKMAEHLELKWEYDKMTEPSYPTTASQKRDALVLPRWEDAKKLYELAQDGNFNSLLEALDHIDTLDSRYRAFTEKIRSWIQSFDEEAICALIEQCMKEDN